MLTVLWVVHNNDTQEKISLLMRGMRASTVFMDRGTFLGKRWTELQLYNILY